MLKRAKFFVRMRIVFFFDHLSGLRFNFQKESDVGSLDTPYDVSSMMHYGTASFSRNRHRTIRVRDYSKRLLIGQRRGFSNLDVLQLNRMYKCRKYLYVRISS